MGVLVFADCDLDAAVEDILGLKYANCGQICVSPNRVYVEASIYEDFLVKAVAKAQRYAFGSGADHGGKDEVLQPVCSGESLARLLGLVEDARSKGARLLCGGSKADREGFFMQPTILADVTDDMSVQQDEIFGPVLPVRSFSSSDDVFAWANKSEVGLSSYVYTKSLDTMMKAEEELMTGNVCINGVHYSIELPHGGLKNSGRFSLIRLIQASRHRLRCTCKKSCHFVAFVLRHWTHMIPVTMNRLRWYPVLVAKI